MSKLLCLSAVIAALFLGSACETEADCRRYEVRVDNVVRVFMHEANRFTVMHKSEGWLKTTTFGSYVWEDIVIKDDVPTGQPMWAERRFLKAGEMCRFTTEIHVHSAADINGGGWNHGKSGRGQTTVVE